jgi:hypothetical protein
MVPLAIFAGAAVLGATAWLIPHIVSDRVNKDYVDPFLSRLVNSRFTGWLFGNRLIRALSADTGDRQTPEAVPVKADATQQEVEKPGQRNPAEIRKALLVQSLPLRARK